MFARFRRFTLFAAASLAWLTACAPLPPGGASDAGSKDPAAACGDLCTRSGYSGSRVDVQSNETNCFCSSGSGTVSDADCADMCTAIGKGNAQTFAASGATKDSCQCS